MAIALVKRKELLDAVNLAGKFAASQSFKFITVDMTDRMSVRAFSTVGACEVSLPSLEGTCPAFEIMAKELSGIISKSKSEWLSISMDQNSWLKISDNFNAEFFIVTYPDKFNPVVERYHGADCHEFDFRYSHVEDALRYKTDRSDNRPHCAVFNFTFGSIMATNGHILYCGFENIPDVNVNIDKRVFEYIGRKANNGKVPVKLWDEKGSTWFEISYDNVRISGECYNCEFPDVKDLITIKDKYEYVSITVKSDDLKYALEQTFGILDNENHRGAVFNFFGDRLEIQATNPERGELAPFGVTYNGSAPINKIETAFNQKYIMNAISGIKNQDIIMKIKDGANPAYFEYMDRVFVIMPMRI